MVEDALTGEKTARYNTLRDYILVVFRHKWKALFFCLIVWTLTIVLTNLMKDTYRSEAKILVRIGWETVNVDPTATTAEAAGRVHQPQAVQLNTALNIIKSQRTAEKVVDAIGVEEFLAHYSADSPGSEAPTAGGEETLGGALVDSMTDFARKAGDLGEDLLSSGGSEPHSLRQVAVRLVMQFMDAALTPNTNIIVISFTGPTPEICQLVVEELADLYVEQHKLAYRNPESLPYLEKKAEESRKEVEGIEDRLTQIKAENDIVSLETRQTDVVENIGRLRQELDNARTDRIASQARVASLRERLSELEQTIRIETVTPDYTRIESLQEQLMNLLGQEQEALSTFTEESVMVKSIRQQIASVQEQLNKEEPTERRGWTNQVNEAYTEVQAGLQMEEANLTSLDARFEELEKQFEAAKEERRTLITIEPKISRLLMNLEEQKTSYDLDLTKLNQARREKDLEDEQISSAKLFQPAILPLKPEKSKKMQLLIGGFVGGLIGAIALTFLFASLDHTFKTPEEVEKRLNLPTLVSIPRVRANRVSMKARMRGSENVSA